MLPCLTKTCEMLKQYGHNYKGVFHTPRRGVCLTFTAPLVSRSLLARLENTRSSRQAPGPSHFPRPASPPRHWNPSSLNVSLIYPRVFPDLLRPTPEPSANFHSSVEAFLLHLSKSLSVSVLSRSFYCRHPQQRALGIEQSDQDSILPSWCPAYLSFNWC